MFQRGLNRRGIEMSFNMIFSIIVIIAIIATAFFAIRYFLDISDCSKITKFWVQFDDELEKAESPIYITTFENQISLPGGIEALCFGEIPPCGSTEFEKECNDLSVFQGLNSNGNPNVFLYPRDKTCDVAFQVENNIDLTDLDGFTCIDVDRGKVQFKINKAGPSEPIKIQLI